MHNVHHSNQIIALPERVFQRLSLLEYLWVVCCCRRELIVCKSDGSGLHACTHILSPYAFQARAVCSYLMHASSNIIHRQTQTYAMHEALSPCLCLRRNLGGNQLSVLPERLFEGLSSLQTLWVVYCCRQLCMRCCLELLSIWLRDLAATITVCPCKGPIQTYIPVCLHTYAVCLHTYAIKNIIMHSRINDHQEYHNASTH
jgi:hypothetical protein